RRFPGGAGCPPGAVLPTWRHLITLRPVARGGAGPVSRPARLPCRFPGQRPGPGRGGRGGAADMRGSSQPLTARAQQVIRSRRIVLPGEILDGFVRVEGGRITEIGAGDPPAPAGGASVAYYDLRDARLLPGMIDLHIHGLGGWDTYDLRPET